MFQNYFKTALRNIFKQKGYSFINMFGLAIGMVLGGIVGLAIDNMIIFAGAGLVLGLAIGYALDNRHKEDDLK